VEDPELTAALKDRYRAGPVPDLAQVIHVDDYTEPDVIDAYVPHVRYIHLDSAGPLPGGNGVTHDWERSRGITDRAREHGRFVILSGGLHAGNVAAGVEAVRPDGVDVESGIRSGYDVYSQSLMQDFVRNATGVEQP
ncbi:MAG TPA: hypothetical protein VFX84_03395, partial [Candidatus Saccharimonadales bacterium]|nr:hypothetical protein [Candidatus Saccharimonadales bacterium]